MKKLKYDDNLYHHNRNYGCRYKDIKYKGFGTLMIENELLRLLVIYEKGTDIIEFLYKPKDVDFLWKSPAVVTAFNKNPFTKEHPAGSFLDIYEGGWQELLPNINDPTDYKGSSLGFHGEVLYRTWEYSIVNDTVDEVKVRFSLRLNRAPFFVTKYLTIRSYSPVVEIEEEILNEGDEEFKFSWGHHPAFGVPFLSQGCLIDVPGSPNGHTYEKDFSNNSLLPLGADFKWPIAKDAKGIDVDLSKVLSPGLKTAFCVSIEGLKEGWYGLTNPEIGIGFGMRWDIEVFKYLWMWAVYRGFYSFPFYGRTFNLALELWSATPDNLDDVIKLGRAITLGPGETKRTRFEAIAYESDARIKGFEKDGRPIK